MFLSRCRWKEETEVWIGENKFRDAVVINPPTAEDHLKLFEISDPSVIELADEFVIYYSLITHRKSVSSSFIAVDTTSRGLRLIIVRVFALIYPIVQAFSIPGSDQIHSVYVVRT